MNLKEINKELLEEVTSLKNQNLNLSKKNKELKKQLTIPDVSQQRELLSALADKFNDSTHTYVGQPMIEETLKAFNCG